MTVAVIDSLRNGVTLAADGFPGANPTVIMCNTLSQAHFRKSATCIICSSESLWVMKKKGYDLYKCNRCRHIQVWPAPSEESLRKLYSAEGSYHIHKQAKFDEGYRFNPELSLALARILAIKNEGKFLDVGCSDGELLWLAKRKGFTPAGIEINEVTASIARVNNIPVFVGTLQEARLPDKEFDVIFLGDVVEHVPDVSAFIGEISRILKDDGVIYVRTPNHECFFSRSTYLLYRMFKIPWSSPTPPHHVHQFSVVSLEMLLKKLGFRVVRRDFMTSSLRYELRATLVFSELKKSLRNRDFLRCMQHGIMGVLVIATYTPIWTANRLFNWRGADFGMDVLFQRDMIGPHRIGQVTAASR